MAAQQQQFDWSRLVVIGLLLWLCNLMSGFLPLVPRAVKFMDDVHEVRQKSAKWEEMASGIQRSLSVIEKLASYFEGEARRAGKPWPK